MLKLFKKIEGLYGFRNSGVPVYQDFYTMKIEAENSGPSQLFCFEGIPVSRGSTVHYAYNLKTNSGFFV